jgi:hypothetical protein
MGVRSHHGHLQCGGMDCVYDSPDPNGVAFVVGRSAPNLDPYVYYAMYKSEDRIE